MRLVLRVLAATAFFQSFWFIRVGVEVFVRDFVEMLVDDFVGAF